MFTKSEYDKIKKVYSVWICTAPPLYRQNTVTQYSMTENNIVGSVKEPLSNYDLMTAIIICLGSYKDTNEQDNTLLNMLDILLSSEISADEKKYLLENRFQIPMTQNIETEVEDMCNLSEHILDKGYKKGIQQGIQQILTQQIKTKLEQHLSYEQIAKDLILSLEEVKHFANIINLSDQPIVMSK